MRQWEVETLENGRVVRSLTVLWSEADEMCQAVSDGASQAMRRLYDNHAFGMRGWVYGKAAGELCYLKRVLGADQWRNLLDYLVLNEHSVDRAILRKEKLEHTIAIIELDPLMDRAV